MVSINLLLLFKILLDQQWMNCPPKSDPIKNIKLIDENWMENELIFINGLVNYQDQKLDLPPGKYKYMGACNPLDKQLEYDPETGEVLKWKVMPYNKVDEISAYHDICYDMGKNKGECDKEMIKSLDKIPYGEMPKWGSTARFLINTKQKLGLGLNSKNVKRR